LQKINNYAPKIK